MGQYRQVGGSTPSKAHVAQATVSTGDSVTISRAEYERLQGAKGADLSTRAQSAVIAWARAGDEYTVNAKVPRGDGGATIQCTVCASVSDRYHKRECTAPGAHVSKQQMGSGLVVRVSGFPYGMLPKLTDNACRVLCARLADVLDTIPPGVRGFNSFEWQASASKPTVSAPAVRMRKR